MSGPRARAGAAYVVPAVLALVASCLALAAAVALTARTWVDPDPWAGVGFVYAFVLAAPALVALSLLGLAHGLRRSHPGPSRGLTWAAVAVIGLVGLAASHLLAPY